MESAEAIEAHAQFAHPDGSWYRLWTTQTTPKTTRGHAFHLHASYDKSGTVAPVAGTLWWQVAYGMTDWDFDTQQEALTAFRVHAQERLNHGYTLTEGTIPPLPDAPENDS